VGLAAVERNGRNQGVFGDGRLPWRAAQEARGIAPQARLQGCILLCRGKSISPSPALAWGPCGVAGHITGPTRGRFSSGFTPNETAKGMGTESTRVTGQSKF